MTDRNDRVDRPLVYVLKRFPRLSETFVLRELLGLEAAGERVEIFSLLPPEQGLRHPELKDLKARVTVLPRRPRLTQPEVFRSHLRLASRRPLLWFKLARRAKRTGEWRRFLQAGIVARQVQLLDARHLHAHFVTAAAVVARDAGSLSGVPVTVTAHAKDIFHEDNEPLVRQRLEGVAGVVTVSEYNADHLRTVVPEVPVVCIRNGMPLSETLVPQISGPVLCVARLVPKKGVDTALRACALLSSSGDRFDLEIVGDGPLRAELAALAANLGITDLVHFAGSQDSAGVSAAYARCSAVILPCRVDENGDRDGMPTVLLEAMARGLPVISTDIAGISELVDGRDTGLLVPTDDPQALAEAIARLRRDPTFASRIGINGRQLVAAEFDPHNSIEQLRRVFRNGGSES